MKVCGTARIHSRNACSSPDQKPGWPRFSRNTLPSAPAQSAPLAGDAVRVAFPATPPSWTAAHANCLFGDLLHAGGFERRSRRQGLQPRNLVAQLLVLGLKRNPFQRGCLELIAKPGHLLFERLQPSRQINHQSTQGIGARCLTGIIGRQAHTTLIGPQSGAHRLARKSAPLTPGYTHAGPQGTPFSVRPAWC